MTASEPQERLSYEQQEAIVFADRERRARRKPWWFHLAKSALPHVCRKAQHLLQEQYQHEAIKEEKTTNIEKWIAIEAQLRQIMAEEMAPLDALQKHVDLWTVCDPATIAKLLEKATTEKERVDVVLGSRMQVLLKRAQAKTPQQTEDSGYDTEDTLSFILDSDGESKSARKRRRQKENRKRRVATEATNKSDREQGAVKTGQAQHDEPAPA